MCGFPGIPKNLYFQPLMTKRPYLIGISGGSGAGKTSIIRDLRRIFDEDRLCIISQDEYYHPREKQIWDQEGYQNFDLPDSIDSLHFANDLRSLISGDTVAKDQYTFNNPKQESRKLELRSAPVIIVEGLFVFYFKEINELIDLRIFIDADDIIKLKRRIVRDAGERNYPLEDVLHRYEHHVLPSYRSYIEPFRRQAHIVINNHISYEKAIDVLAAVIRGKQER